MADELPIQQPRRRTRPLAHEEAATAAAATAAATTAAAVLLMLLLLTWWLVPLGGGRFALFLVQGVLVAHRGARAACAGSVGGGRAEVERLKS